MIRIISTICESDLNEPDFARMNKLTNNAKITKDYSALGMEFISQYSQYWDKERKTMDLIEANKQRKEQSNDSR